MTKKEQVLQALLQQLVLPLYFHEEASTSAGVLQALYNAGVRVVEYTNRGAAALENFRQLKKLADETMQDLSLGIGTIKTAAQANDFINAGADFIVCPTINTEVGESAQKANLLWIPGCMTPTEIATAEAAGATIVKIFPGNLLGPDYISAVKELFPGLMMMPTGGVELEEQNLSRWFRSGVVAVGMGSKLVTKAIMEQKNYKALETAARQALQMVHSAKGK